MCVLMPVQVLVLVLVLESQVLDNNTACFERSDGQPPAHPTVGRRPTLLLLGLGGRRKGHSSRNRACIGLLLRQALSAEICYAMHCIVLALVFCCTAIRQVAAWSVFYVKCIRFR